MVSEAAGWRLSGEGEVGWKKNEGINVLWQHTVSAVFYKKFDLSIGCLKLWSLQVRLLKDILEAWKKEVEKKPPTMSVEEAYAVLNMSRSAGGYVLF